MNKSFSYKIHKNIHDVIFTDNLVLNLNSKLSKINSDKKILIVYDDKIQDKIVKEILDELKITGSIVIKKKIKGEKKNKSINQVLQIIEELNNNKFTKKSVVVALGGGVVGDLCGLVSSLYLRGLIYINIPTTMTSMVDSCIGGKTGVNHKNIINLIGTYYHPTTVIIYYKILLLLPYREYLAGLSEIIKCSLISDNKIFRKLKYNYKKFIARDKSFLKKIILDTLKTKYHFFKEDIYENNQRLFLNFGHTFAHAIEMATDKLSINDFFRHGEAVALGMLCELNLSRLESKSKNQEKFIESVIKEVENLFEIYKLPTKLELNKLSKAKLLSDIFKFVFFDKKKISNNPRYIKLIKKNNFKVSEIENFDNINITILKILI
jgi:3-dehydroquinate synthase